MIDSMSLKETTGQRVARQIRALLERYDATSQEVERRTGISYITINRWKNAEAKTQPHPHKLRKVAEAFGETMEEAFPETDQTFVEVDGRRIALKAVDGRPLPRDIIEKLRHLTIEKANDIHEAKTKLKKKPS